MRKRNYQYLKFVALAIALPFIYGCGAGAGVGSLIGFLFGGGGFTGSEIALLGGLGGVLGGGAGSGAGLGALSTPEPASMLLVGGGLIAMGYFKFKGGRRSK